MGERCASWKDKTTDSEQETHATIGCVFDGGEKQVTLTWKPCVSDPVFLASDLLSLKITLRKDGVSVP